MSRDNSSPAHYAGNPTSRTTRRLDRLNEIVRVPNSPSVALTRYTVLTMLIVLIAVGLFLPSATSSSRSLSSGGALNASSAAQRVMPSTRMFVSSIRKTGKAEIATDKNDYAPGDKVVITGSGWKPGEAVRLRVHRTSGTPDVVFIVKANPTGRFRNAELLIKKSDLGVAFVLTATGMSSKYTAEITFTDGNITIKPAYEGQTNAGGLQTFTLTKRIFVGSTNCSTCSGAPITVTGVNATTGHTFALANTESALISASPLSEQNGPFGTGWFSPTMSPFTADMFINRNICIPGTATGTYIAPFKPGIVTLDGMCANPKTQFNLGDTICVKVFGDPALQFSCTYFQIHMDDPFFTVRNCSGPCNTDTSLRVSMDQGTYTFTLPATNGPMGADNRGPWLARVLDCVGVGNAYGQATFQLHNPTAGQEAADLQVNKSATVVGGAVPQNGTLQYQILAANIGPDPAQNVTLTDTIPTNTTFVSFQQLSGPTFTCMAPAVGSTGTISCTGATLPVGTGVSGAVVAPQTAEFRLVVKVDNGVANLTTISNTASVSSVTAETHPGNNMSTATNTVQSTACSLTCPPDLTGVADALCNSPPGSCGPGKILSYPAPTATGSCGAITCTPPSGSCFPVGTTTVGCFENNAGCNFTVRIDLPPPCTVACPANQSVPSDPNQCGAVVNYPAPTTTGICGTVTCSPASGSFFPVGTTTVTCSSNSGVGPEMCTFTVMVNDTQPPTITCPANITTSNDPNQCGAVVTYPAPTVSDNCPGVGTPVCSPASGSFFPKGTTTVTCNVADSSNNTASCTFTVTVNDTQPPTITCSANITTSNDLNQCGAVVTYPPPTVSDNCPAVGTPMCSPASGSFFPKGTTTVTCNVADSSGNTASCAFTVTVNDTQPPTITCPATITAKTATSNDPCAVVSFAPVASDNCPGVTTVCSPPSNSCFPVGTTTVTCTATDASGNTATCSFTVNVFNVCLQDDSNPGIVFLGNTITGAYSFCCNGTLFTGMAQVTKKGSIATFQQNGPDRRVLATSDGAVSKGSASLQSPPGTTICTIIDRDTRNNTCNCQ